MIAHNDVFISYSYADAVWLERLRIHLTPLQRDRKISLWDDTRIKPGSNWRIDLKVALDRARVAVLLVSADFLASEFITTNELPHLLAAAEKRGTLILPIIVSPCWFEQTPQLARFQAVNSPDKPLLGMHKVKREAVFVKLSRLVEEAFASDRSGVSNLDDSTPNVSTEPYSDGSAWISAETIGERNGFEADEIALLSEDDVTFHVADWAKMKNVSLSPETVVALERLVHSALDAAVVEMLTRSEIRKRVQAVIEAVFDLKRGIRFRKLICRFTILDDFSFKVEETETLSAADQDIGMYRKCYAGTVPCTEIESLQFQASVLEAAENKTLVWIPAKNEPLGKEFLVCPTPPLKVHEPARTFHFSSIWPSGAELLKHPHGRDLFQVYITPNAVGSVDSVEVFIQFEAPGVYIVERMLEMPPHGRETSGRRDCWFNAPFYARFENVPGGTLYSFLIDRVS